MNLWVNDLKKFKKNDIQTLLTYFGISSTNQKEDLIKISKAIKDKFVNQANIDPSLLPYGGDINQAMRARDRDAIKKIMEYRKTLAEEKKETSKAPVNPIQGLGCQNDADYITSEDWSENNKPDLKIYFLKNVNNPTLTDSDFNIYCANKENFLKWVNDPEHHFKGWVPIKKDGHIDESGHGGRPSFFEEFIKLPINFILKPDDNFKSDKYIAIPFYIQKRVGNPFGVFAIGALHGQEPGETIYYLFPYTDDLNDIRNSIIKKLKEITLVKIDEKLKGVDPDSILLLDKKVLKEWNDILSDAILDYISDLSKKDFQEKYNDFYNKLINYSSKSQIINNVIDYIKKDNEQNIIGDEIMSLPGLLEKTPDEKLSAILNEFIGNKFKLENIDLATLIKIINIMMQRGYNNEYDKPFATDWKEYNRLHPQEQIDIGNDSESEEEVEDIYYYLREVCDKPRYYNDIMNEINLFIQDMQYGAGVGSDPNMLDSYDQTLLSYFLQTACSNTEIAIKIVSKLAPITDLKLVNSDGNNALMVAVTQDYDISVIKILLEKGKEQNVKINQVNNHGNTVLMECIYSFLQIINNRGSLEEVDDIIIKDFKEQVEMFIKSGSDLNIVSSTGDTPFILLIETGIIELIRLGIKFGAQLNDPAHPALCYTDKLDIIKLLIAEGADVNGVNTYGQTALMVHINSEDILFIVTEFHLRGANLNIQDNNGNTLLIYAAKDGKEDLIQPLLKFGADKNIKNKVGWTALAFAVKKKDKDIIQLLK